MKFVQKVKPTSCASNESWHTVKPSFGAAVGRQRYMRYVLTAGGKMDDITVVVALLR